MAGRLMKMGQWGETQTCGFLMRKGFRIIERNYHSTVGEIDIVAKYGDDFYFVEVKTRIQGDLSNDTAITYEKKLKMKKTVSAYCAIRNIDMQEKGIIFASLMVVIHKEEGKLYFRFAVMY